MNKYIDKHYFMHKMGPQGPEEINSLNCESYTRPRRQSLMVFSIQSVF